MTQNSPSGPDQTLRAIRGAVALTGIGMLAERVWRGFWPVLAILMGALGVLMLGLQDLLPLELVWSGAVIGALALLWFAYRGARGFQWPQRDEVLARVDETLPGRPLQALLDQQASGLQDPATRALWLAHQDRMAQVARQARPAQPDLRLARRDPYALRYAAALVLVVALLFGSVLRLGSVSDLAPGAAVAGDSGPSWEGWIEPPRYTGLPTLYLNDQPEGALRMPEGSRVMLRFYGQVGDLTLSETVSARTGQVPSASDVEQEFSAVQGGELRIDGPGGRLWQVDLIPDHTPEVAVAGPLETDLSGQLSLPFEARDDYGIVAGTARITLDLAAIERRHGLRVTPEPRADIELELPLPISGGRVDFTETLIENFSQHPWANLPVRLTLSVEDASGLIGESEPSETPLAGRRFFDPLAAAIIEQRRDLLWSRENADRIAMILRAVSHRPDGFIQSETAYLRLRVILRRLEAMAPFGLSDAQQDELAQALWDLALDLEEGDLGDALERMRRAQERLSEAMRQGASDQEIAELMQELRDATDDYLRQLTRRAQQEEGDERQLSENMMLLNQDDLQRMMDRIQELMEQGRMAEAQEAMREFQELMENMRVTQGQPNGSSPGDQAMEGLADTLREQQGLSDQAFRDLQEQFNPGARRGESQGNEGRNGGQGRGQSHEGQGGAEGNEPGAPGETLAQRQRDLRDELRRQQSQLPGQAGEGQDTRDALDRAGRAMEEAEDALRRDDYAGAIDRQSEAMEALREGLRALGEQLAQDQESQPGQGEAESDRRANNRDPLGRNPGSRGGIGSEESMLQGEDVYRRARDLLDEIRRRSGDGERPLRELDYLRRLLDRF